jgi:hypothetical protein
MDEIITQEKKIFTGKFIIALPFAFFNYLAQLIVNADNYLEIPIPETAENFFKINCPRESAHLFQLLRKSGLAPNAKSFLEAYRELFLYRYQKAYQAHASYTFRRIPTPEQYGILEKLSKDYNPTDVYLAFDLDQFIAKNADNSLDLIKMQKGEDQGNNVAAALSALVDMPGLSLFILRNFNDITERGFFPVVFRKELEAMILEVTFELLYFSAKLIYQPLKAHVPLSEAVATSIKYYSEYINVDTYRFPSDFEPFELLITEVLKTNLDECKELTAKTKEIIFYEFIQIILTFIQAGLNFPQAYYEVKFREPIEFDRRDFQAQNVADVYLYMENGMKLPKPFESYSIQVADENMQEIISYALQNDHLYRRFINLS